MTIIYLSLFVYFGAATTATAAAPVLVVARGGMGDTKSLFHCGWFVFVIVVIFFGERLVLFSVLNRIWCYDDDDAHIWRVRV